MVSRRGSTSLGISRKLGSPSGSFMSKGGSDSRCTPAVVTRATTEPFTGFVTRAHGTAVASTKRWCRAQCSASHGRRLKSCTATALPTSLSMGSGFDFSTRAKGELAGAGLCRNQSLTPSEAAPLAFARGQVLETGRPPARADGLRELGREPLRLHLAGEPLVVVDERDELDLEAGARAQERVPHPRRPVVLRPAADAHVDQVPNAADRANPPAYRMRTEPHDLRTSAP